MDDWQEAALSNRHLHNRRGQNVHGKGSKGVEFLVQRTFGTYELKCPAAEKLVKGSGDGARLEIYCLNDTQNALYAELIFPGLLNAVALLAGSRRVMNTVLRGLSDREEDNSTKRADSPNLEGDHDDEDDEDDQGDEDADLETQRVQEFAKNSFRNPKFWLRWQGEVLHQAGADTTKTEKFVTDSGYLVFSGNACNKLSGTISCEILGWNNVKVQGWKDSSKGARNFKISWHEN